MGFGLTKAPATPSRNGTKSDKKRTAKEIIGEVLRIEGCHDHVPNASEPHFVYGLNSSDQVLTWFKQHEVATLAQKVLSPKYGMRRQRSDSPSLLGAIVSYPEQVAITDEGFIRFRELVIAWAKKHYGALLVTAIVHDDEAYPHIHLVVAGSGESMKPYMAGHAAAAAAKRNGGDTKAQGDAYKDGCVKLQDQFWAAVAAPCGLSRKSDAPRPRRTRAAQLIVKEKLLNARELEMNRKLAEVEDGILRLLASNEELNRRTKVLNLKSAEMAEREEMQRRRAAEVAKSKSETEELVAAQRVEIVALKTELDESVDRERALRETMSKDSHKRTW